MEYRDGEQAPNPPAFNIPAVVLAFIMLTTGVHLIRTYLLTPQTDDLVILTFGFISITYHLPSAELLEPLALYWSPITHGFLHGDWTHLIANTVWLLAFGSAVARRFGSARFSFFMAAAMVAGAGAHYAFHPYGVAPVIGASGAVSGCMGAAVRFAFRPGGASPALIHTPALPLIASLKNRNIMTFVVIWFALNWLVGSGAIPIAGNAQIAWEAHMGGFLFGWIAFSLFDPKPTSFS